jgi:hypothetical protein
LHAHGCCCTNISQHRRRQGCKARAIQSSQLLHESSKEPQSTMETWHAARARRGHSSAPQSLRIALGLHGSPTNFSTSASLKHVQAAGSREQSADGCGPHPPSLCTRHDAQAQGL